LTKFNNIDKQRQKGWSGTNRIWDYTRWTWSG